MVNQNWFDWFWYLGVILGFTVTMNGNAVAQVTADQTLGTQVTSNGKIFEITGGTTVNDTNLFHSFSSFSVPNGGAAIFQNASSIANIFSRVTGGTPSDIQGLIRAQGSANLFLMNPNGIIFGKNAQLNIGGSFVATTANAIQFPGGAEFSLTSSVASNNSLLSVNPTAFLFNQIAAQGANSIENRANLFVPTGKSLILLGGRVAPTPESTGQILMDGGIVTASGGRVEFGGLTAPGTVGLNVDGNNLRLSFPDGVAKADISLVNQSFATAFGANGGDIVVNANNFNLLNSSSLNAGIVVNQEIPSAKAGDISVNANGIVAIADQSFIRNVAIEPGNGGNINVVAQSLKMINGSGIQAIATQGNSGVVNIKVEDTVSLSGRGAALPDGTQSPSAIISSVQPSGFSLFFSPPIFLKTPTSEKSGGINIQAQNLSLADGGSISVTNFLADNSGDIKIQASNSVILNDTAAIFLSTAGKANAGNVSITTNRLNLGNNSQISTNTVGSGNAGNINIVARDISIDNSRILASTTSFPGVISNVGNAGNVNIETERILLTNGGFIFSGSGTPEPGETIGRGGNINVTATDSIEIDAKDAADITTGFFAETSSASRAGDITLKTKNMMVRNGGTVSVSAFGNLGGNAGNIFISSNDAVVIDNSTINSRVGSGAVGDAGEIKIQTRSLTLTNGGGIDTQITGAEGNLPGGRGKGGRIHIDAADAIIISGTNSDGNSSVISTGTLEGAIGQGGDIIINTDYFRLADEGLVSARTRNSSNGGNITINARVFEVSNGGFVSAGTLGSGKSGNITINAADNITISTSRDTRTGVFADTTSTGDGGTISLSTNDFNLFTTDLNLPWGVAAVSTSSQGGGIAGNINITAKRNYRANNGSVTARAEQAGGGNINITASNIRLRNNSDIRTDLSRGQGSGGNITLDADIIIALEDSDVLAFAPEGKGGNITFNTRALLTDPLYSPTQTPTDANSLQSLTNNGRVDINATGAVSGSIIGVPDITFLQNSFTELPDNLIDTNTLIANSCIARSPKQKGTFLITGSGGLPTRPGDASASTYPTGDVRNVTNDSATRPWKKNDRIVEPQGVYRLTNGQIVMSRECR